MDVKKVSLAKTGSERSERGSTDGRRDEDKRMRMKHRERRVPA